MTETWATLLAGVVGSHAYGLNTPTSDVDRMSIAAAPTASLVGLAVVPEREWTVQRHDPDHVVHEAGKFARLAVKCNPSVVELLYLPDELYERITPRGAELIGIRSAFLSADAVRDAFLGYAGGQFGRLTAAGRFPKVPIDRIEKHSRHLHRLCLQGLELYTTGTLTVRLADPEDTFEFGARVAADAGEAERFLADVEARFAAARPALPEAPDLLAVESWLLRVRADHFKLLRGQP